MVDFEFYSSEFFGSKIPEEEFPYYARRALDKVFDYTLGRADAEDETTHTAVCAIADIMFETEGRTGLSSEAADGYSAGYKDVSREMYLAAQSYIPASLFYRGVVE